MNRRPMLRRTMFATAVFLLACAVTTAVSQAGAPGSSEMLRKLYDDPRVISVATGVAP